LRSRNRKAGLPTDEDVPAGAATDGWIAGRYRPRRPPQGRGHWHHGQWCLGEPAGHFVWIGIRAPAEDDLRRPQTQLDLHELAIEDALNAHHRAELDACGETTFLPCAPPLFWTDTSSLAKPRSSSAGATSSPSDAARRPPVAVCVHVPKPRPRKLASGESYVLYLLIDFVVDSCLNVIEKLAAGGHAIEEHMLAPRDEQPIARI
jgi:Mg2+ and Co2+ transporter CorA